MEDDLGQLNMSSNQRYLAQFGNSRQKQGANFQLTYSAVPTNYELAAIRHGFDPGHAATLKDFQARNIGDLKTFKT